jgi:hypothetical protein
MTHLWELDQLTGIGETLVLVKIIFLIGLVMVLIGPILFTLAWLLHDAHQAGLRFIIPVVMTAAYWRCMDKWWIEDLMYLKHWTQSHAYGLAISTTIGMLVMGICIGQLMGRILIDNPRDKREMQEFLKTHNEDGSLKKEYRKKKKKQTGQ